MRGPVRTGGADDTVPVDVGRDEAAEAARRELADPAYQAAEPSLVERAATWVAERIAELASMSPGGGVGLVVLVLTVLAVAVIVRLRVGRIARSHTAGARVFSATPRSAAEHRAEAERAAAGGELDTAIRERFRAVVRELEERGVLDTSAGRTVAEFTVQAGARLPAVRDGLADAARIFDEVRYGGRTGTDLGYRRVVAVDEQVRGTRRVPAGVGG